MADISDICCTELIKYKPEIKWFPGIFSWIAVKAIAGRTVHLCAALGTFCNKYFFKIKNPDWI